MKKNYSFGNKTFPALLLISIFSFINGQSQTVIYNESFPNQFNPLPFSFPPPASSFNGSTGTWTVSGNDDATVAVYNSVFVSSPRALKIINESTWNDGSATAIATSPAINLSPYSTNTVNMQFSLYLYNVDNGNDNYTFSVEFLNGSTWTSVFQKTADDIHDDYNENAWNTINIPIPATYLKSGFKYRFKGFNAGNNPKNTYLYIDDVKITYICPLPSFSSTPTQIFDAGGAGGGYEVGDVYRWYNVVTSPYNVYADLTIEKISNAILENLDQNTAGTGVTSRIQPEIKPDQLLTADREGYIQFAITFKKTSDNTTVILENLQFRHFDIDGHPNGSGTFQETSWITGQNAFAFNSPNALYNGGNTTVDGFTWRKTLGELENHSGFTSDPEIYYTATFNTASTIRFRMGYKFVKGNGGNHAQEPRYYAADFGCFTPAPNSPLPVRLFSFSGAYRNQKAVLNWSATNEANFEKYEVQRSANGVDFTTVGVALPGPSVDKNNYEFPDDLSAINGNVFYYRLSMVDKNGDVKYSQVVMLRRDSKALNGITINPNPVTNGVALLRMTSPSRGSVEIRIIDLSGKVLLRQKSAIAEGNNSIAINNLAGLPRGTYTVQMINGDDMASTKLSILK